MRINLEGYYWLPLHPRISFVHRYSSFSYWARWYITFTITSPLSFSKASPGLDHTLSFRSMRLFESSQHLSSSRGLLIRSCCTLVQRSASNQDSLPNPRCRLRMCSCRRKEPLLRCARSLLWSSLIVFFWTSETWVAQRSIMLSNEYDVRKAFLSFFFLLSFCYL